MQLHGLFSTIVASYHCNNPKLEISEPVSISGILIVGSHKDSKAWDRDQQCCRGACPISEWSDISKYKSRDLKALRDLITRCFIWYWNRAQAKRNDIFSRNTQVWVKTMLLFIHGNDAKVITMAFCPMGMHKTTGCWYQNDNTPWSSPIAVGP